MTNTQNTAPKKIKAGYCRCEDGCWYVQRPSANQWGFELVEMDGTILPGGLAHLGCTWTMVPASQVPRKVKKALKWALGQGVMGS